MRAILLFPVLFLTGCVQPVEEWVVDEEETAHFKQAAVIGNLIWCNKAFELRRELGPCKSLRFAPKEEANLYRVHLTEPPRWSGWTVWRLGPPVIEISSYTKDEHLLQVIMHEMGHAGSGVRCHSTNGVMKTTPKRVFPELPTITEEDLRCVEQGEGEE